MKVKAKLFHLILFIYVCAQYKTDTYTYINWNVIAFKKHVFLFDTKIKFLCISILSRKGGLAFKLCGVLGFFLVRIHNHLT